MQIQDELLSWKRLKRILIALAFALVPIICYVVLMIPVEQNLSLSAGFGLNCQITYIIVRNEGDSMKNLANWSFRDAHGSYYFPEYWLAPGKTITLWSGYGIDDQENLYAGRSNPMWASEMTWKFRNNNPFSLETSFVWQSTCHPGTY